MLDKNELLSSAIADESLEEVRRLLKEGASPNAMNQYGDTPLHGCVKSEDLRYDIAALLIEHGADPSLESMSGKIISEICADKDFLKFIDDNRAQYLKAHNLRISVRDGEWFRIVELLKDGASVSAVDEKGNTPLHICALIEPGTIAAMYAIKIARILIKYGADPEVQNLAGHTVYDLCDTKIFAEFIKQDREEYIKDNNKRKEQESAELDALLNSMMKQYEDESHATAVLPDFTVTPQISGTNKIEVPVQQKEKIIFLSQ